MAVIYWFVVVFFFKQKTAYEMRISDWSSDVCSSDLTTKASGTGLGLAIVNKIIEEHGGRIDISNRREGGARISILLMRLADVQPALDEAAPGNDNAEKR